MAKTRNPEDKAARLIGAVGEALMEQGHRGLGVNKVANRAGVSKPMVYEYFGNMNGLVKAHIKRTDPWLPSFAALQLSEDPTADELKDCFIKLLQEQFRCFYENKEMQRLVLWQVSEFNPLMRAASMAREKEGERLLQLTEAHFRGSGISLKAVLAMLVGGIYFNVLHSSVDAGTVAGIDLKNNKDFDSMLKAIEQIIEWAFNAAEKK